MALYQFNNYKTQNLDEIKVVEELVIVANHDLDQIDKGAKRGEIVAEATNLARDLVNHPSNYVTPAKMADTARDIAKAYGLKCKVLERRDMEKLEMGGLIGVAKGSHEPPKFIILEYNGGKKKTNPIVLVGKSITFDSGGISIKPAEKMEQMKDDMSGGAAVLGCMKAAARLAIPLNIVGLLPATENMPGGSAIKPGDVLKTMSGKTIEVISTDAEGRMILADAITYATRYKPAAIIDLATLTGACVVALGNHAIGLMGNNSELTNKIRSAGDISGERVWELPLWEEYSEQIKSDIA
ncbi:MAG: leucyl aminopeptidase, partial [Nitrospirota bacterium]